MLRRIGAWALLVGFVLMVLNIAVFGFYREITFLVYLVIVVFFLFGGKGTKNNKDIEDNNK